MKVKLIKITWSDSNISVQDAWNSKKKLDKTIIQEGLYQIYGHSPIYGPDVLLYIGRSQNLINRTDQHLNGIVQRGFNLRFLFGTVEPYAKLALAETILIALHKPSYNSQNLRNPLLSDDKDKKKKNETVHLIHNHGNRGALMLECSDYWWKDRTSIDSLANSVVQK